MQVCKKCLIEKPLTDYRTQVRNGKAYTNKTCKTCQPTSKKALPYKDLPEERKEQYRQAAKRWAANNPEKKAKGNRRDAWKRQGIDPDLAETYYQEHRGKCDLCKSEFGANGRSLSIDHCHTTGRIRGMLCDRCNTVIGLFRDDPNLIQAAYQYLIRQALVVDLHH